MVRLNRRDTMARRMSMRRARWAHDAQASRQATTDLALAIIRHGRPYRAAWYDDGDAETGPTGGLTIGVRWGQLRLEDVRGGGPVVMRADRDADPFAYPAVWREVRPWATDMGGADPLARVVAEHLAALARDARHDRGAYADDYLARRRRDARDRAHDQAARAHNGPPDPEGTEWISE